MRPVGLEGFMNRIDPAIVAPPYTSPGADSLGASTSGPAPRLPRLETELTTEVAIVGGGYSGLAAAHALERRGVGSVVLEANAIGWGASGRNGGVVSPKFRLSFPQMASDYDLETARRMHRIAHDAVHALEQLVAE